jgi:hypothetical protein
MHVVRRGRVEVAVHAIELLLDGHDLRVGLHAALDLDPVGGIARQAHRLRGEEASPYAAPIVTAGTSCTRPLASETICIQRAFWVPPPLTTIRRALAPASSIASRLCATENAVPSSSAL